MSDDDLVRRLRDMLHELATPVDVGELHPEGRPLWPEEKDSVWDEALVAEAADAIERLTRERGEARGESLRWQNGCNAALDRAEAAERKVEKLREALRLVEEWWLTDGMKSVEGAPYAIFQARAALAETEKQNDD